MSETETNPVAAAEAVVTGVDGQEAPAQNDDISTEEFDRAEASDVDPDLEAPEGQTGEEVTEDKPKPDDDLEEVEHDGQKYRVPKAVRPLLMLQADYTKKTQDLAAQRRTVEEQAAALETEKVQQAESLAEIRAEHIRVGVIEQTIERVKAALERPVDESGIKLKDVDWIGYRRAIEGLEPDHVDVLKYQKLRRSYEAAQSDLTDLDASLGQAKTNLSTKEAERLAKQQEASQAALAKQRQETGAVLKAEVPGWNGEEANKTANFAAEHLNVSLEEMFDATDPRIWKMAHEVMTSRAKIASLETALKQQKTADNHAKAQTTTPAATPRGTGGANARDPSTPRGDALSTEEWMRRRNAKFAKAS